VMGQDGWHRSRRAEVTNGVSAIVSACDVEAMRRAPVAPPAHARGSMGDHVNGSFDSRPRARAPSMGTRPFRPQRDADARRSG
jgi:hypothetical protein